MTHVRPSNPQYYFTLGNFYKKQGKLDKAVSCYERSLEINPQSAKTRNNMGNALREQGKYDKAIESYEGALKIDPEYTNAYNNIGLTYLEMAEFDKAIAWFAALLEKHPCHAEAHNALGIVFRETAQFQDALKSFRSALHCKPMLKEAHQNLSALYLLLGNYHEAWREYRWFWNLKGPYEDFQKPLWNGSNIGGKTLLLHAGEGYGDTIQLIRYAPVICERGSAVLVGCQKQIGSLLKGVRGIEQVIVEGERIPNFDVQSSMFRLPIIFETSVETIPQNVPYITIDPQQVDAWREKLLLPDNTLRIGLRWRGGHQIGMYRYRTFPQELFSALSDMKHVAFYSLQTDDTEDENRNVFRDLNLIDLTNEIKDFADTASMIASLDLVISIDTAVAHLAGALGKPVWTLLPFVPDWRWMLNRDDSPWYPTMRLFRQPSPGDWKSVIAKVYGELKRIIIRMDLRRKPL